MKLKLSYSKLIDAKKGLEFLGTKELSYRTALKISKNLKTIQELLAHYLEESVKLEEKYLEKDEHGEYVIEGGGLKLKSETKDEYWERKKELDNFEVEIDLYQINITNLDGVKVLPEVAGALEFLVKDTMKKESDLL